MKSDYRPKLVILAGGLGTRIAEESDSKPKPMVEIGGKPLLLHIMEHYSKHGVNEFIICVGYKGYQIKEYFANFIPHSFDFTVDLKSGSLELHGQSERPDWKISIVDTGSDTNTGGRLKRIAHLLPSTFFMTYGDGLSDIDISDELRFHKEHGRLATVAAVRPPSRFAVLDIDSDNCVSSFREKPVDEVGWINGGFFVLESSVLSLILGDKTAWEGSPLSDLASSGQLMAFYHNGFWQPVDTLRDKRHCEDLWQRKLGMWSNLGEQEN
jgi:glucose-1-phosphate cytidylyltransferase